MAIGPSGGFLKRMFSPAAMKNKMRSAVGIAKSGGAPTASNASKQKGSIFSGRKQSLMERAKAKMGK